MVVGVPADPDVPEDHLLLWFGEPRGRRISEGGSGGLQPELWLVPEDVVETAAAPDVRH